MGIKEELSGGRQGIYEYNNLVMRPAGPWTGSIHEFLNYIINNGATFVPKPYGVSNGKEILSFVPGDVFNDPLPESMLDDSMIIYAAKLLLKYHKYSEKYIKKLNVKQKWMLPSVYPIEVMCHGDFAPYNVTIVNNKASGIIDFDTLHPGPIIWDIAYAIYRWVPFNNPKSTGYSFDLKNQIRRTKLFLDSYGLDKNKRSFFPEVLIKRLEALINYMRLEAKNNNKDVKLNIDDGHIQLYLNDIKYIKKYREVIKDEI